MLVLGLGKHPALVIIKNNRFFTGNSATNYILQLKCVNSKCTIYVEAAQIVQLFSLRDES